MGVRGGRVEYVAEVGTWRPASAGPRLQWDVAVGGYVAAGGVAAGGVWQSEVGYVAAGGVRGSRRWGTWRPALESACFSA